MTKRRKERQKRLAGMAGQTRPARDIWNNFKKHKISVAAMVILILLVIAAISAGFLFDYDTQVTAIDAQQRLEWPGAAHWFGTDQFGRDIFIRVIYGARYSLFIGIVTTLIAVILGSAIGASCAYFGGLYDVLMMRVMDSLVCIPSMLLMLALVSVLGKGLSGIVIALVITSVPGFARMIRSIVLNVVHQEFTEAARACGTRHLTIIVRHILPNCFGPILVDALMNVSSCIMAAAGLSFLGMGIQTPAPEWGAMLNDAMDLMRAYPYLGIFPGAAIVLTSLCFNLLGDGLTDALDPKNR